MNRSMRSGCRLTRWWSGAVVIGLALASPGAVRAGGGTLNFFTDFDGWLASLSSFDYRAHSDIELLFATGVSLPIDCDPVDATCDDGVIAPGNIGPGLALASNTASPGFTPDLGQGLVAVGPGAQGAPVPGVGAAVGGESIDILLTNSSYKAVGIELYQLADTAETVDISVFGPGNNFLGFIGFTVAPQETTLVGIVVGPDLTIERINIAARNQAGEYLAQVIPLGADDCPWDIDGDNEVDPFDYSAVLARFGMTGLDLLTLRCDQDYDGFVDPFDSNAILARFGNCP